MRNSKTKGFTLIELIVVIAIIGILAAILVPSMLGYVRNARISSANSGAKQVHTACASAITQLGIANYDLGDDDEKEGTMSFGAAENNVIAITWGGDSAGKGPNDADVDLAAYLGETFKDYGYACFNPSTYSVTIAGYATQENTFTTYIDGKTAADLEAITEGTQKSDAKAGNIYGIYPAPALGETT